MPNRHERRSRTESRRSASSRPSAHASADDARFAAETLFEAGIHIVEITMTVPDALGSSPNFAPAVARFHRRRRFGLGSGQRPAGGRRGSDVRDQPRARLLAASWNS